MTKDKLEKQIKEFMLDDEALAIIELKEYVKECIDYLNSNRYCIDYDAESMYPDLCGTEDWIIETYEAEINKEISHQVPLISRVFEDYDIQPLKEEFYNSTGMKTLDVSRSNPITPNTKFSVRNPKVQMVLSAKACPSNFIYDYTGKPIMTVDEFENLKKK